MMVLHVVPDIDFRDPRGTPVPAAAGGSAVCMARCQMLLMARRGGRGVSRTLGAASAGPRRHVMVGMSAVSLLGLCRRLAVLFRPPFFFSVSKLKYARPVATAKGTLFQAVVVSKPQQSR